ncbi:DNA mismatch repair protein MSH7 [Morella rubra]|uniref:DNA mismatch repair protein MSH7 n=1 Tax=Morella rubra TaxID=262757 RepID=A0A6A1VMF5_9ROSI|nr:DNA mismatch repair protein MSH7 [Morella rubra]
MSLVAQYPHKLPNLERLLGRIKASVQSSTSLLVPLFGKKLLKQQTEGHIISTLSKVCRLPTLSGGDGLDQFLTQFEAAVDSEFPNYQVGMDAYAMSPTNQLAGIQENVDV